MQGVILDRLQVMGLLMFPYTGGLDEKKKKQAQVLARLAKKRAGQNCGFFVVNQL